ncbi:MAG: carboxypeptidase-like regulatory domain-containing protein, partial [Planctomycetes bacterium]|nr:carboxypeptidase-like regulatory domain-containing protein [Planctomycetota bacterium]
HYFLPPGTREVTFSAPGHTPRTFDVEIAAGLSTLLEVQLGPGPTLTVNGPATQDNTLDLFFDWPEGAGQFYMNGISLSAEEGFTFKNGVHVPLDFDLLYSLTLGVFPGWFDNLDGTGHGYARFYIPIEPALVGLTAYMGYFVFDAVNYLPLAASAAVKLSIDA